LFSIILSSILLVLSYFLSPNHSDYEKSTSYECGFEPFGDARNTFNLQFYIVGILFIIFDLEIAFMLPWSIILGNLGVFGY
jgi:NADH-quinone oxidoreductase subunit A